MGGEGKILVEEFRPPLYSKEDLAGPPRFHEAKVSQQSEEFCVS